VIKLNDDFDENEFGDKFIREARISREHEIRLRYIDSHLEKLNSQTRFKVSASQLDLDDADGAESTLSRNKEMSINENQIKQLIQDYYSENGVEEGHDEDNGDKTIPAESNSSELVIKSKRTPSLSDHQLKILLNEAGVNEDFYNKQNNQEGWWFFLGRAFKFRIFIDYKFISFILFRRVLLLRRGS
jgi:hypothetical protein